MKTRLVTFDLDGTLFDTAPEIALAVNRTLDLYGYAPLELDTVIGYIGQGTRELMRQVLIHHGVVPDAVLDSIMPAFYVRYDETAGTLARPYPGVPGALERLRSAGIQMAVVTNKDHRFAQRLLENAGLGAHFDIVVGGDSLACRKPHPLPILHCIERLEAPVAATAHIGDSRTDVETARRAGVQAWAVPYGYNYGVPIADAAPDRIFPSIAAMAEHVFAAC
ncbi:phosphoglycolate phosphatase [Burkholderia sp. IDO3]|uniref:phosphoglycolate phosphatase n=1 Tax=Burkholderia sp. IDO3 TaxID=1705310 RepID=UPI000BBA7FDE|nr:phosphoglycolate phosphatase [Burkholderia sp. IDO3]AXK67715.1 phosphoglycolate phosphatase [Burkholderia sp. IDO3]PCD59105.1 phosphoglycolate phosphatase [Burkholderia sp. IDO3]